ncbi:MAG TPA: TolC family protein [Candidatus Methylomirabilis sp.]|nr:TolC family protein [Candidatus Methylomirabilis sp.]
MPRREKRGPSPFLSHLAIVVALLGVAVASGPRAVEAAEGLPRIEGPLTLEQAVALALGKSLRVKAADADTRAMDSMRKEALAPFWPQLSANGYLNEQRLGPNVYTSAGNTMARNFQVFSGDQNRDGNFTAMYSLFAGGRDYYGYKAATARADAARQMLQGTGVDVAMQTRLDYIAALREAENAGVTGDLLKAVEERLRVTREMFDAGRIPRYYLLRDETERANTIQMEAMARSRADQALIALKTTLGVDLSSPITLADPLEYRPVKVSVEDGIRQASEGHPDLKAAVKQRQAAESEVRAAYSNYFPQISAAFMNDWIWSRNRNEPKTTDNGYSVGVVMTLPIFDGFMRENGVTTAKARLDKTIQAEALVRQQIAKEVNQTALMLTAAEKGVEASKFGLDQAEEEFRIVQERFASGRGIQVEILDAQASVTRARFNQVAALADYNSALAMWIKATGRTR